MKFVTVHLQYSQNIPYVYDLIFAFLKLHVNTFINPPPIAEAGHWVHPHMFCVFSRICLGIVVGYLYFMQFSTWTVMSTTIQSYVVSFHLVATVCREWSYTSKISAISDFIFLWCEVIMVNGCTIGSLQMLEQPWGIHPSLCCLFITLSVILYQLSNAIFYTCCTLESNFSILLCSSPVYLWLNFHRQPETVGDKFGSKVELCFHRKTSTTIHKQWTSSKSFHRQHCKEHGTYDLRKHQQMKTIFCLLYMKVPKTLCVEYTASDSLKISIFQNHHFSQHLFLASPQFLQKVSN